MSNLTMRNRFMDRCMQLGVWVCVLQGVVLAQTPDLRPGNFELGLYAGASYGVDAARPMGGVNLSYSLPKLLLPYVEFSYFPELIRKFDKTLPGNNFPDHFTEAAKIEDIHAGLHIRILPHESRVVPYGVIGFGVLHSRNTGTDIPDAQACVVPGISTSPCTAGQLAALSKSTTVISENDPAINFGAGLRVYHKSYLGYRIEYKLYRPLSGQQEFQKFFSKAEGGIFFQFGGK
jgi:hypothetical protein